LLEALIVVAAAAAFAFAANALSPRGLKLARDYFPGAAGPSLKTPLSISAATNAADIEKRIKDEGLQPLDRAETERLFHDPRCLQGMIVFVDAREAKEYAQSHIPGAFLLDHFYPEKYLADALIPCMNADQVVVYCHGGDCDDAMETALTLRDAGVPVQKLFVYAGGFDDWSSHHLPLEQGPRNSGLEPAQPK